MSATVDGAPLRVVQVTRLAQGGGAERIASSLHQGLLERGHRSWMATAINDGSDPTILTIPPPGSARAPLPSRILRRAARALGPARDAGTVTRAAQMALRAAASPRLTLARYLGHEIFDYPGTAAIPDLPPERPDLLHCHNLHGSYFDLRELAPLSQRTPLALTLHDEWTFTGHCAYGVGCERWRIGCGSCPDLTLYPAIERDATHRNWGIKRDIYARSRLYVSTPSQWLMDRARSSILADGVVGWRMIPNGVDRSTFAPADQGTAREALGLPVGSLILLFTANRARRSPFKDWETVLEAATRIAVAASRPVLCLALGDDGPPRSFPNGELRFVPYRADPDEVARFYQAADLYLHAARADTFPTTILEALATGLPVVATAVGGIPEEVRSLAGAPGAWTGASHAAERATGVLVPMGDATAMGRAATTLLEDDPLRDRLRANAAADAALRFDRERQLDATIDWYREVIADWRDRDRSTG